MIENKEALSKYGNCKHIQKGWCSKLGNRLQTATQCEPCKEFEDNRFSKENTKKAIAKHNSCKHLKGKGWCKKIKHVIPSGTAIASHCGPCKWFEAKK